MAFEWQLVNVSTDKEEELTQWLQKDFEPFAVADGYVWLKQRAFTEHGEAKSSANAKN